MEQRVNGCHVMAKPSGSVCNIDCEYCFYLEKDMLYPERKQNWRMSDETLETYIKQYIEAQAGDDIQFAWQGGEPTLMGIDFFQKAMQLCEKYGQGKTISHAFQTNGILINDEWCELFSKYNFLIGVSIDGPSDLHDYYRVTRSGKPTHAKVMEAIACLKKHKVPFNTLTVVSAKNVKHPLKVYEFLKQIGSTYLQFIPLVERNSQTTHGDTFLLASPSEQQNNMTEWSVGSDDYGQFLCEIFDHWVERDVGKVFVQSFDTALASWLGQPAGVCVFSETCGHAFAMESNGDLYQCDHYVYPEYKLGNIHDVSIDAMNQTDEAKQFGRDKRDRLNGDCERCEYRFACHGGCPKHRFDVSKSGYPEHNYLCHGYYRFFKHADQYLRVMADLIAQQRPASEIMFMIHQHKMSLQQRQTATVGRNEPCICGSGKKFKKCCGS